jgi:hypothetical protein
MGRNESTESADGRYGVHLVISGFEGLELRSSVMISKWSDIIPYSVVLAARVS